MATKKPKHDEVVKAATESRPAADDDVREEQSTGSMNKLPAEVEFCKISNRLLSKLAYAEGFEGDAERRTAAYSNVREDSSTASTYKSPAEVEFRKKSNELTLITGLIPFPKTNHHVVVLYDLHSSRTNVRCTPRLEHS